MQTMERTVCEQAKALKKRLEAGGKKNPFWFLGPCVVEDHDTMARIAEAVKTISVRHRVPVVFKASFDKANRTSYQSFRGLGFETALKELQWVKKEFELPVVTDIHESVQAAPVAEVADILQIPAFLCRQTDLLEAACKTGRLVNVKKGQFLSPSNVKQIVEKLAHFQASGQWITERGTTFGYGRLVVDFAGFPEMEKAGANLIMDVTHSVQLPGASEGVTGGIREAIPYLARAAAAVGVSGFFAETHPVPEKALSDGLNAWPLAQLENLVVQVRQIAETAGEFS